MKTPKRNGTEGWAGCTIYEGVNQPAFEHARWKRKNRVKRLKRTIARLEKEKVSAYHKGHKDGYDLAFARSWF